MNNRNRHVISKSKHVVTRVVDGEAVIVEPQKGMVNVINTVGSRIWELLDGKHTVAEIANVIADEYEVSPEQALSDTMEFIEDIESKRLASAKY